MGTIFAVGDIHGCFHKLEGLLNKVNIDLAQDTLIFMGDYIDRGPGSFEVVERLLDLKKQFPGIIFLKGNHEKMLIDYLTGLDKVTYLYNGGRQTLESYLRHAPTDAHQIIPGPHLEFFKALPLYYETADYIFVHAGLKDKVPLAEQKAEDLLWIRDQFVKSKYDFGKRVIFGHTPFHEPLVQPNKIGIDTGAVYDNKLTCLELPEVKFYFI